VAPFNQNAGEHPLTFPDHTRSNIKIDIRNTPQTTNLSETETTTGSLTQPAKRVEPCAIETTNRNNKGAATCRGRVLQHSDEETNPSGVYSFEKRRSEYRIVRPSPA